MSRRLQTAWSALKQQYLDLAEENSREGGPGLNFFSFLKRPRENGTNCDYLYLQRLPGDPADGWDDILNQHPYKRYIENLYDSEKHFVVAVVVPDEDDRNLTEIKMFFYETREEIEIEFKEKE